MKSDLLIKAKKVLEDNRLYDFTIPAHGLYANQVLWDSCFIAIGKSNYDINNAKNELRSLLRGQWQNGMLPNIIFNNGKGSRLDRKIWRSTISNKAPRKVATTGITQPPMLAIAVQTVGQKMSNVARKKWYAEMLPAVLAYHQWLYKERDPNHEGLVVLIHPWETGLDTTPPWMSVLNDSVMPKWIKLIGYTKLDKIGQLFRKDTKFVPEDQRTSNVEALALFISQRHLKAKSYDNKRMLDSPEFAVQDLTYNSIFLKANLSLIDMAQDISFDLPANYVKNVEISKQAINSLCWDETSRQYFSRNFITKTLIKEPSIAAFMPLYANCVPAQRLAYVLELLNDPSQYLTKFPVPSVPINSKWFKPKNYWQGPTWVNMNWFIIGGLMANGEYNMAKRLAKQTIAMVDKFGFYEYYDPRTGQGVGIDKFSWTAALIIDLMINS